MSTKLGFFTIFTYLLPGAAFLSVVFFHMWLWGELSVHSVLTLTVPIWIILGGFAYIVGIILYGVSSIVFAPFFKINNPAQIAWISVRDTYPNLDINFDFYEWPILQAQISLRTAEIVDSADRLRAEGAMLRSMAFCLLLLMVVSAYYFINNEHDSRVLVFGIASITFAIFCYKRSIIMSTWSYKIIFETALAIQKNAVES